jgi:hypothetical protein
MKYLALCITCVSLSAFGGEEISLSDFLIRQAIKFSETVSPEPASITLAPKELVIDLRNPKFKNGILYTDDGGIVQNEDIRIQAKSIQYTKRVEDGKTISRIEAEGELCLQFKGKAYVGNELAFDFETKTGVLYGGKTYSAPFYIGGEKLLLKNDGTYSVEGASLTTCENADCSWDIHAAEVAIKKEEMLNAKNVRFRFFHFPVWLPSFKLNLKKTLTQPLLRYKVSWDKSSGPKVSVRYQVYSWKDFALFLRGEYRLKRGFGGAVETEYFPVDGRTSFVTRSYLATDVIPTSIVNKRRYRLQGELHSITKTGKTKTDLTWDKFSDVLMPGDFRSEDFELNTAKKTQLNIRHHEEDLIAILYARPRVNPFETIKQELPTLFGSMRPLNLADSGFVVENWTKTSYLDLAYSDRLSENLHSFHSARLETHHEIYRPLKMGHFLLNPTLGVVGIYYSNTPVDRPLGFGLIKYGLNAKFELYRTYSRYKHVIEPYALFDGYSRPTTNVDKHYIFSIQDGYNKLNQLKFGFRNLLFSHKHKKTIPSFYTDIYANAFFTDHTIPPAIPKMYLTLGWNLPCLAITSTNAWNFWQKTLDFANLRTDWTFNKDAAMSLEVRYRSKYDWRKADHENFILDVSRNLDELLASPLSDRRITILSRFFFRINPFWTAQIESHHGFYRINQRPYNEFKVDLFTWISAHWKLRLTYLHTQRDDRVTAGIELIKR